MLSFLCALSVNLEGVELLSPECLHLVEPCLQGDEGLGAQPVHAKAGVLVGPLPFDFDKTAAPEHPQVPAHGRTAHPRRSREFASPAGAMLEQLHYVAPGGIGQRSERCVKFIHHQIAVNRSDKQALDGFCYSVIQANSLTTILNSNTLVNNCQELKERAHR
jgi:hypothetical protein